jgi:hypothetical protein
VGAKGATVAINRRPTCRSAFSSDSRIIYKTHALSGRHTTIRATGGGAINAKACTSPETSVRTVPLAEPMTIRAAETTIWFKIAGISPGNRTGGGAISVMASILPETMRGLALQGEATTTLAVAITSCGKSESPVRIIVASHSDIACGSRQLAGGGQFRRSGATTAIARRRAKKSSRHARRRTGRLFEAQSRPSSAPQIPKTTNKVATYRRATGPVHTTARHRCSASRNYFGIGHSSGWVCSSSARAASPTSGRKCLMRSGLRLTVRPANHPVHRHACESSDSLGSTIGPAGDRRQCDAPLKGLGAHKDQP